MQMPRVKAAPQKAGKQFRFTVVVTPETFSALENASSDLTWRQLAQKAIREYAAALPQQETPASTEPVSV